MDTPPPSNDVAAAAVPEAVVCIVSIYVRI